MPRRHFKLTDDVYISGRWHLSDPVDPQGHEVDPWQFTRGLPVRLDGRLGIPIDVEGKALDFTTTPLGATPIVHERVATLLSALAPQDIQLLPVDILQHPGRYFLVNTLRMLKCIDDARCEEVRRWRPEDGQPEKVGEYRSVAGLRIDASAVGEARIFRPWGWDVALIVSEDVQRALERAAVTGMRFTEV